MVGFTVNLEVISRVGEQQNKAFSRWHEIQKKSSKTISTFHKIGNITSVS